MGARWSIATWNLERSGAQHRRRISGQLQCIDLHDSDVWVLTETHDDIAPNGCGHSAHSQHDSNWQKPGERLVSIWSRHALQQVQTADPVFTVAARVNLPGLDRPVLVYGTVITYAHDGVPPLRAWERHRAAVATQSAEWLHLSQAQDRQYMCVAGDFNMNLDGTRWYGVRDARETLLKGLEAAGLRCLTTQDLRATQPDIKRASVDHICYSAAPGLGATLTAWSGGEGPGRMSDHNGLRVEIAHP